MPSLQGQKARIPFWSYVIVGLITQNLTYLRRRFVSVPNLYVGMYVVRWAVLAGRGNFFRNEWLWLKQEFAMSNELNSFSRKFARSSSFLSGMKFYVFLCEIGWSSEESFATCKEGRLMVTKHAEQIEVRNLQRDHCKGQPQQK